MKATARALAVFYTAVNLTVCCFWACGAMAGVIPAALLIYPNASKVVVKRGGNEIMYRLDVKFPASGVIAWVSEKLHGAGWKPLTEDFLNPGIPTSQAQGWQHFAGGTNDTEACVALWLGDWKDSSGNIVRYSLQYRYTMEPCIGSHPANLEVIASYFSAATVKNLKRGFHQLDKEHRR